MKYSVNLEIVTIKNNFEIPKNFNFYSKEYDNLIYCFEEILTVLGIKIPLNPKIYTNRESQAICKSEEICDEIANFIKNKYSLNSCFVFYYEKIK